MKMRKALSLVQERAPWLEVDGGMHGDMAVDGNQRANDMPQSTMTGNANMPVLPNIDAANISYSC
jgi:malate dehydrogenase (oxaloacetate-decarboxylating)(NADP+)